MYKDKQAYLKYQKEWREKNTEYKKVYRAAYLSSVTGKANVIWGNIKHRVKSNPYYSDIEVCLTKQEFLSWIIPELEKWLKDNGTLKDVSIDRIDPTKHYEHGNLQLITFDENRRRARNHKNYHAPDGFAWCGKCKAYLTKENFYKNKATLNGLTYKCKLHWK